MALYEPIRDGFREFNRMLIDAKMFDEQQAKASADEAYRYAVLESNLVQREFENQMSKKRYQLASNGDTRAATQLDQSIADQKFRHDVANNQLQISRDNLKINQEELKQKKAKHVLDMRVLGAQATEATKPYTLTDVDLNGLVPKHLTKNENFMIKLNELSGAMGASIGADLLPQVIGEGGQTSTLQMKPVDQEKFAPGIASLVAKYNDPNLNSRNNIEALDVQIKDLQKIASGPGEHNKADQAQAKRMIKVREAQIREEQKTFRPANNRDDMLERSQILTTGSQWWRALGMDDQADAMGEQAQSLFDKSIAADQTSKGKVTPTWKTELGKNGMSVPTGEWVYDSFNMEYRRKDKDGNLIVSTDLLADFNITTREPKAPRADSGASATSARLDKAFWKGHDELVKEYSPSNNILPVTSDVAAGTSYAKKLYTQIANNPVVNKEGKTIRDSGAPRDGKEAGALKSYVLKQHKKDHNDYYQTYLEVKNSPKDLVEYEELALSVFGYIPSKPYAKQIWKGRTKAKR